MSLILDALRKSEHGRHGASDSVLPLIVTPRAGRARKKRVAYLPILIMLFVVIATAVVFLYRERIFPPRTVTLTPPTPVLAEPQPQAAQQGQQQKPAETPVKEARQASIPGVEPTRSMPSLKSEKLPVSRAETAVLSPAAAVRPKEPGSGRSPQMESEPLPEAQQLTQFNPKSKSKPKPNPKPKPESGPVSRPEPKPESKTVNQDVIPAALSTFSADFIRKVQPLHLDFHVYSSHRGRRMVYINNREYEEGDRLKNNLTVVRIVPQGAVLQWNQQPFLLTAQD